MLLGVLVGVVDGVGRHRIGGVATTVRRGQKDIGAQVAPGNGAVGGGFDADGILWGNPASSLGHLTQKFSVETEFFGNTGETAMSDCVSSDVHARDYIALGYTLVNSAAHVDSGIAGGYKGGMKSIVEIRLENFRTLLGKHKQAEIARRMGRGPGQVQQWAAKAMGRGSKGSRNIDDDSARLLEKALGLPENWMDHDHAAITARTVEPLALPGAVRVAGYHPEDDLPAGFIPLPAVSLEVGAGHRLTEFQAPETKARLYSIESLQNHHLRASDLVAYRVRGNSMEPYLFDGDWVVIDRSRKAPPSVAKPLDCRHNTFVFRYEDGVMVKMLQALPDGGFTVVSLNSAEHKEFVIPAASVDRLEIYGKVVDRSGWSI